MELNNNRVLHSVKFKIMEYIQIFRSHKYLHILSLKAGYGRYVYYIRNIVINKKYFIIHSIEKKAGYEIF